MLGKRAKNLIHMKKPSDVDRMTNLKGALRRWLDVIELFARKRSDRLSVQPEAYAALYEELAEALKAAEIAEAGKPKSLSFIGQIKELSQPWVSLQGLQDADKSLLLQQLEAVRQVEREAHGGEEDSGIGLKEVVVFGVLFGIVFAVALLGRGWSERAANLGERGADFLLMAQQFKSFALYGLVAGLVIILAYLVFTGTSKY